VVSDETPVVSGPEGPRGLTGAAPDVVGLLERESELGVCAEALERAAAGRGGLVVVEGPPGIGKTELLRAVHHQATYSGLQVMAARGLEVEREVAFGGVRQLLDPVLRVTPNDELARLLSGAASPARGLFADAPDSVPAAADATFAMLNALYWVIARLADAMPLVLAVDDAHWLDPPSIRLVGFLVPRIEELRALVVVATRPLTGDGDDPALGRVLVDPASRVLRLKCLSPDAVGQFVQARMGEPPDRTFVDACADVTAGNPFYLAELLRELAARGSRPEAAQAKVVRTVGPPGLTLALRFRTVASNDGLQLARALAVLGDGARLDHVAALAGLERDVAASAADALGRESILAPGSNLVFAHPIVRTAVYADLRPRQRATMHSRAAELLRKTDAAAERVAAHLLRSDPAEDPWAVEVLRAAATAALGQGAPDTAAHYLRRAVAEPPAQPDRTHVLLELGRAEATAGQPDAAAHLVETYALATDPHVRADAANFAALPLATAGRLDEAMAMLGAAAQALAGPDPDRALALEAQLIAFAMNEPNAAPYRLRLDRLEQRLAGDSPGGRMLLCHVAYRRMWRSNDAARAAQLVERALADGRLVAEHGSESMELNSAAMTLICADRLELARKLLDTALAQTREQGSRHGFALVSFLRSQVAYRYGTLRDVEAEAHAAVPIAREVGWRLVAAVSAGMLILALLERGALDAAAEALTHVGLTDRAPPPQAPFTLFLAARGRLRLARRDVTAGLADLRECGRRAQDLEIRNPILVPWRAEAALAHRARGELDAAWALADEELTAARDWGTPGAIGAAQRLAGLLSTGDQAIALLREAVAALAASPARLEHSRALVDLGAALRRANHRTDAREPLSQGLDLAERCGATVLRKQALDELAAVGVHPRRTRRTGIEALTASERRVARLAAGGLGNIDIAQQLFVTRKTIEKHLGNVYRKLDVNSRDALSDKLSADGILTL
jgi:DNA-binding CsgD family transcriptional regulator